MAQDFKIEWTHHTFNPWRGCTKVSPGCTHCYADTMSKRNPTVLGVWGPRGRRVVAAGDYWRQPLRWNAAAQAAGERHRVFCASLADVFEGDDTMPAESRPDVRAARERLWELISYTPHLDWLLLTKRPGNILEMIPTAWRVAAPSNVWYGTSVEDQQRADERIPALLRVPARVRFLSCEPLLGPVVLQGDALYQGEAYTRKYLHGFSPVDDRRVHWVIVGGESGAKARPMHPDWARSLRDQCETAGVAFFFKQWGEHTPYYEAIEPDTGRIVTREYQGGVKRVGKKVAGRLLDGRTWDALPQLEVSV